VAQWRLCYKEDEKQQEKDAKGHIRSQIAHVFRKSSVIELHKKVKKE